MMPTVFAALRFLGLQGALICAAFLFYEGVPGINYVTPYLRFIPAAGPLLDDAAQGRVGRAFQRGELSERLAWQEKQRRWEIATREKIDRIEDQWNEERERQAVKHAFAVAELERALANDKASSSAGGAVCRPAVSRGVSRALDKIGR